MKTVRYPMTMSYILVETRELTTTITIVTITTTTTTTTTTITSTTSNMLECKMYNNFLQILYEGLYYSYC